MAPDKIFAGVAAGHLYASRTPIKLFGEKFPEYIRKDALLEWLESKVYEHNEDRFDDGFNAALGQVIDKLNSL